MASADTSLMLEASALVVAHPDDEVLWFSSILASVGLGVICFEDCDELPLIGACRRRAAAAYPLANIAWLRRPEPCSFHGADWDDPVQTAYGMALNARPLESQREDRYRSSYNTLRADLQAKLRGARNVFTHNPWGEYGHPDHVQVSRVVTSLQEELGFRLWYSSYVSPRSMRFAAGFLAQLTAHVQLPTDAVLASRVSAVYRRYNCWTWHPEYTLFEREAFLERVSAPLATGGGVPLNCVLP